MEGKLQHNCAFTRFCKAWTTFTPRVKSSTRTSSQRTSCCAWRSSLTKRQWGAAAPRLCCPGRRRRPSPQAQLVFVVASDAGEFQIKHLSTSDVRFLTSALDTTLAYCRGQHIGCADIKTKRKKEIYLE